MRVYLCGPINGCTDEEANGWREKAIRLLRRRFVGVQILNPMDRDFRGTEHVNAAEIVSGDKQDIDSCTAVLVDANRPSWGTAMEIMYAADRGIRVVAWHGGSNPSPWLREHATMVGSLEFAVDALFS